MEKIFTGKNHSLWQLNHKNNQLNEQMKPLVCDKIFGRGKDKFKAEMGGWDCDCGIYVIGKMADVEVAFEILLDWMKKKTEKKLVENDLPTYDSLVYMGLYKSKKQDLAVIVGGGYYECTDKKLEKILYELKNVDAGELGANYSDDQDLYHLLRECVDYAEQEHEKPNPMHLDLLAEVFSYWEKQEIETKEDRIDMGWENVDAVVERHIKSKK
jgi:hypothetical protein